MTINVIRQIDEISNTDRSGLKIVNDYYLKIPVGNDSNRLAAINSEAGMMRYNTDRLAIEVFVDDPAAAASQWVSIGLGTDPANPQGDFMHRFGDMMFGDLRLADSSQSSAVTAGSAQQGAIITAGSGDTSARILNSDGTESFPSYTFGNDVFMGMYRVSDDILGFSVLGQQAIQIEGATTREDTVVRIRGDLIIDGDTTTVDSQNLTIVDNVILLNKGETGNGVTDGAAGIEVERGTGDNAGWFFDEVNDWWGPTGPSGSFTSGTGITGPVGFTQTIGRVQEIDTRDAVAVGILYIDGTSIQLRGSGNLGTEALPSYSWEGDENSGVYSPGADRVAISTNGADAFEVDATQRVLIGDTITSQTVGSARALQVHGLNVADSSAVLGNFAAATTGSDLAFLKSRNPTVGGFSSAALNDSLGNITWYGDDGVDYDSIAAQIIVEVDAAPSTGDMPGRIVFKTTVDGAETPTTALTLDSSQNATFAGDVGFSSATANLVIGTAALATTATDGFIYMSTSAGTPTGVATAKTGRTPIHYDTSNNKLYAYNSGWQEIAGLAAGAPATNTIAQLDSYVQVTDTGSNGTITMVTDSGTALTIDNAQATTLGGHIIQKTTDSITAAGTTQGTATALSATLNRVTTITAATADGVVLPTAVAGLTVYVINSDAADTLEIFPNTSDSINDQAVNTSIQLASGARIMLMAANATNWYAFYGVYA